MSSAAASIASAPRVIRVFVSSTFCDMHAERDELVKQIFPQLRKLCERRGVTWGEVDLRWGITDEQKAEGKVLPICLEEIRRCRPYFIGLLGERYGWVPEEVPPAIIQLEPWLAELRGHSVTELEILHGVLNNPQMANHAYFYFRDPGFVRTAPLASRANFEEGPTAEETRSLSAEEAKRRAEERKQKLAVLKERIRVSGFPVREGYRDPRTLGELVLADLTTVIDRLFPEGSQSNPLDREAAEQEAFAQSRARVYISRQEFYDRLDEHAHCDGPPLTVLGESGLGKSALLANWALRYRAAHPGELLLMHFIGATPASADWAAMVRRILGEFNRQFDLKIEIPDKPEALRMTFANALCMAATKGRVILIFDALNQLEDRDQALDLVWLPPVLPADVRLIVSTLPGRALDDLKKRGWPTLQVQPLDPEERKKLIVDYLAQYTHTLSADRVQCIAGAPQAANPLYLRALLEELRLWGEHETLPARIEHYLSAVTVPALYQKILERYEQDYERERPWLVRDAMRLLWAARRGLSEAELMDLLGGDGQPLPRACWSPLYLAAEQSLVSRSGLISFFHNYLRQAVEGKYLPQESDQHATHLRLANYFAVQELSSRKTDELPWQLMKAEAWSALADLLMDLRFMNAAWKGGYFDIEMYWAEIEGHTNIKVLERYNALIEAPEKLGDQCWQVLRLLRDFSFRKPHLKSPLALCDYLIEQESRRGNTELLRRVLAEKAVLLFGAEDYQGVLNVSRQLESLSRENGDNHRLQLALDGQSTALERLGDTDNALKFSKAAEEVCRANENLAGLQAVLGNRATLLANRHQFQEAMPLLIEAEEICRRIGHVEGLIASLVKRSELMAVVHPKMLDPIMELLNEAERLARQYGKIGMLVASLELRGLLLSIEGRNLAGRGDYVGALKVFRRQEQICGALRKYRGVAEEDVLCMKNLIACLINHATILAQKGGDAAEALSLAEEALHLAKQSSLSDEASQVAHVKEAIRKHTEYRRTLAEWNSLPAWRRALRKEPVPPEERFIL